MSSLRLQTARLGGIVWCFEDALPYIFEILSLSGNILIKALPLLEESKK